MKIDYAIMSSNSNPMYLDFWPKVSELWKRKFSVEPILLYIDETKPNIDISEEYGTVIRQEFVKNIPISIQTLWIRYWFPSMFPNQVSIIADIDMLPLSKKYFLDQIKDINEDKHAHIYPPTPHYPRVPSGYHIAKGKTFKRLLKLPDKWRDSLSMIHEDFKDPQKKLTQTYWFLDEDYAGSLIMEHKKKHPKEIIFFKRDSGRRIDRMNWKFDLEKVKSNYYYDCHCARPYQKYKKDVDSICDAALSDCLPEKTPQKKPENTLDSHPFITGMTFRKNSDYIYDEFKKDDIKNLIKEDNKIIFLKTDYVRDFFKNVLPQIQNKIILITHNSALKIYHNHKIYLDNEKITRWYAQNVCIEHEKLESLPLGLPNARWPHGNIENLKDVMHSNIKKESLLYVNFDVNTNPERKELLEKFKYNDYSKFSKRKPLKEYLIDLASSKYALSPEGSGTDCHRIWECLYLNTIPIVKKCKNISFYEDLPILIIDSWDDISESLLEEKYEEIYKKFNRNRYKLHIKYWINKIKIQQENF